MKIALVLGFLVSLLMGCASIPASGSAAFFDTDLATTSNLILEKLQLMNRPGTANQLGLIRNLCVQAAGMHGFRLIDAEVSEAASEKVAPRLSLILSEQEYSLDLENWNSVAVMLRISEPALQIVVTEESHLGFKSAGYVLGLLDRLFAQLQKKLGPRGTLL